MGDTSYELFCESGKEWDGLFEKLGATRIVERIDCDVDYDAPASEWTLKALPALAAVDSTGQFYEDMVEDIAQFASGSSVGAGGEDGFTVPVIEAEPIQVEISIFRFDPSDNTTGRDSWACSIPGHLSVLEALRAIKETHDGTLSFRDGNDDDPTTAISVNGRLIIPGRVRIDSVVTSRGDSMKLRIDPIPVSYTHLRAHETR